MRGAGGTTALGLGIVAVAGLFDAEPLYVPGVALAILGAGSALWVREAARGVRVLRTIGAARVVEDEALLVELEVRAGRLAPPAGEIEDPLLVAPSPLAPGRRRTRVRIRARFTGRGRRELPVARVVVRDPLGLAARTVVGRGRADEVLVLPRVEPVLAVQEGGEGRPGGRGPPVPTAEVDFDGIRPHRSGTPASRISWPVFARTGELHERVMRADADARPIVVLDLRGTAIERDVDAAVRAAASLCVHLSGSGGGVALLLPGDRRPLSIEPGLRGWPHAHARLALAEAGSGPVVAGLGARRGTVFWVAARPLREHPRALSRAPGAARVLVVPGALPDRRAVFTVAGCSGYALARRPAARVPRGAGSGVA